MQTPKIIINLKHVRFVDTPTFKQLLTWLEQARSNGGDIKLCELSLNVHTVLSSQTKNLTFEVYKTEVDGLQEFANGLTHYSRSA